MTAGTIITLIVAIVGGLGGVGAILTAVFQRRRGNSQSETEARAQFTNEFNAIVASHNQQFERLDKELAELRAQVRSCGRNIVPLRTTSTFS